MRKRVVYEVTPREAWEALRKTRKGVFKTNDIHWMGTDCGDDVDIDDTTIIVEGTWQEVEERGPRSSR